MVSVEDKIIAYFKYNNIRASAGRFTSINILVKEKIGADITLRKHINRMTDNGYLKSVPYRNDGGTGRAYTINDLNSEQVWDESRVLDVGDLV